MMRNARHLSAAALLIAAILFAVATPAVQADPSKPLAGYTVVIDPGHQLGNKNFPAQINRRVDAGNGHTKACNTTGTATNSWDTGKAVPEATVNWNVAIKVKKQLELQGATVIMTGTANSNALWGPCINVRGMTGNGKADLLLSIHADGASASSNGFHVLIVGQGKAQHASSLAFAKTMRGSLQASGFKIANYVRWGIRSSNDYATLNLSKKPSIIVEMGNMRNKADALRLTSPAGQTKYANGLAAGVKKYLLTH